MKPFVSVVVPAFNEEKYLPECLDSLLTQNYPKDRYEIIVVDNGSTDQTYQISKSHDVITLQLPQGFVGAVRNFGAKSAKGEILAFIDADCVADALWLQRGVALIQQNRESVMGGGCMLPKSANWIERNWLLGNLETITPKELIGACIFIPKDIFKSSGGFDESITSGEDTDFSLKLKKLRYRVKMDPQINLIHLGNAKTIPTFIRRQIWHGENYFSDIKGSIKDPIFLLTTIGLFLFIAFLASIIFKKPNLYLWATLSILPILLSIKRLRRSKIGLPGLPDAFQIYALDSLYLLGRMIGLIKSIGKILTSPK